VAAVALCRMFEYVTIRPEGDRRGRCLLDLSPKWDFGPEARIREYAVKGDTLKEDIRELVVCLLAGDAAQRYYNHVYGAVFGSFCGCVVTDTHPFASETDRRMAEEYVKFTTDEHRRSPTMEALRRRAQRFVAREHSTIYRVAFELWQRETLSFSEVFSTALSAQIREKENAKRRAKRAAQEHQEATDD
jgi:hypothetical protein